MVLMFLYILLFQNLVVGETIDCSDGSCFNSGNVTCTENGETCQIQCFTNSSCANSILYCGESTNCIIECSGDWSCWGASIHGNNSDTLTIISYTNLALIWFGVFCPDSNDNHNCQINCLNSTNSCYNSWIYASQGLNDVKLLSNSSDTAIVFNQTRIFCGDGYSNMCIYDYRNNICANELGSGDVCLQS